MFVDTSTNVSEVACKLQNFKVNSDTRDLFQKLPKREEIKVIRTPGIFLDALYTEDIQTRNRHRPSQTGEELFRFYIALALFAQ